MKKLFSSLFILSFSAFGLFAAKEPSTQQGAALVTEKCLICHARELIESQRLTAAAWKVTVKKMKRFGADLTEEELNNVTHYLSRFSPGLPPTKPEQTDSASAVFMIATQLTPKGDKETGAELYSNQCARCHGKDGEGKIGPRLRQREIPTDIFATIVLKGSGTMPSFGESLRRDQVESIRSYLVAPK